MFHNSKKREKNCINANINRQFLNKKLFITFFYINKQLIYLIVKLQINLITINLFGQTLKKGVIFIISFNSNAMTLNSSNFD